MCASKIDKVENCGRAKNKVAENFGKLFPPSSFVC
jgi:hypothetical protein